MGFSPPSESHETSPPHAVPGCGSFHEVSCLFAQSTARVRSPRRVPIRRRLPPSGFLNLSAVCSPRRLRGLVPSRVHVQASLLRVFPSPRAVWARRPHLTLWWLPLVRLPLRDDGACSPTTGLCSPGESVACDPQLSEPHARYPLKLSPLQGLLRFGRGSSFPDPPLMSFPRSRTRRELWCPTGYSRAEGWVFSRETTSLQEVLGLVDYSRVRTYDVPGLSFRLGRGAASPLLHRSPLWYALRSTAAA